MGYPYKSLTPDVETRVLKFAPNKGGHGVPISCSLVHTSLESPIPYEALSYVWSNSVIGKFNDADPEKEVFGWTMSATGISETVTRGKMKDMAEHPALRYALFGHGYPRPKGTIIIDGIEVEIGGELYSALQRLGSLWEGPDEIAVWIDALCINQNDIHERNWHVQKMGDIYRGAKIVRIWLGESGSDADRVAFNTLNQIRDFFDARYEAGDFSDHWLMKERFHNDPEMAKLNWNCLSAVLNRAWFQRTWVIQEVALANSATVHLGGCAVSWEEFAAVIRTLRRFDLDLPFWAYSEFTADTTISLMDSLRIRRQDHSGTINVQSSLNLVQTLHDSRNYKCTVLSDKIYGVLTLADDKNIYAAPDYSLPTEDVFKSVAISHIENTKGLTILYHCSKSGEGSGLDLPSWVPDWTRKCHHEPFYLSPLKCSASGSSTPSYKFVNSALMVRGRVMETIFCIDHVRNVPRNAKQSPENGRPITVQGESVPYWGGPDITGPTVETWNKTHAENQRDYVNNIMSIAFPEQAITAKTFEALWRTFVCNQDLNEKIPPASWGTEFSRFVASMRTSGKDGKGDIFEELLRSSNNSTRGGKSAIGRWDLTEKFDKFSEDHLVKYYNFVDANGRFCYNRRFFKTDAGRFGWAPDGAAEGDVLAIIDGLDVPLVLRQVEGGYEVVGDCYAHGLMSGEAISSGVEASELRLV